MFFYTFVFPWLEGYDIYIHIPSFMPKMPVLVFEIHISPCERIHGLRKKWRAIRTQDDLMGIKGIQDLEDLIGN